MDALGAELYAMRMLQPPTVRSCGRQNSILRNHERGFKGIAALERVLYAARQMGTITIVDCLRRVADHPVSAFADATSNRAYPPA